MQIRTLNIWGFPCGKTVQKVSELGHSWLLLLSNRDVFKLSLELSGQLDMLTFLDTVTEHAFNLWAEVSQLCVPRTLLTADNPKHDITNVLVSGVLSVYRCMFVCVGMYVYVYFSVKLLQNVWTIISRF